jgi:catechol 2,3-dioxygenase-like lactoylglutathione lyase family enzyme
MRIHHVGLVCKTQESADRFYGDLLGLERTRSFPVSTDLSGGLFGFDQGFQAINYVKGDLTFEIFVVQDRAVVHPQLHHLSLEVEDLKGFLERCRRMGVQIIEVPKQGKIITMIKDFDGNLFEMRERA